MERLPILSGAYQTRPSLPGSQLCINMYPELNLNGSGQIDEQAPVPISHFMAPGLILRASPPAADAARCLYMASNGNMFEVVGTNVYLVDPMAWTYTLLGALAAPSPFPVSMADNGLVAVIVDGSSTGFAVDLTTHAYAQISDPNFFGGTRADYVDTYFVFNTTGYNQWQISLSLVTFENLTAGVVNPGSLYAAFDPLDVAAKTGWPDAIATIIVVNRNPWLVGQFTTEPWYNSGAADFTFAPVPGTFQPYGCIAPNSIATQANSVFWLHQDRYGKGMILQGNSDYSVQELSPKGLEAIIQDMAVINDAVGGCYQINGHGFYVISFPTTNRTFAIELKTKQVHELAWTDPLSGALIRHRANCWAYVNGQVLIGDWQNGNIYQLDQNTFSDAGNPTVRRRTLPHLIMGGELFRLDAVIADLQGGTLTSATPENPPKVFLRVSTNRGGTFSDPIQAEFGPAGDYGSFPIWRSLGMARDFLLMVEWSDPINTVFNGIWYDATIPTNAKKVS